MSKPHFGEGFDMSQPNIGSDEQRLVVSPRRAMYMLDCGRTHVYELIAQGELVSYLDGRSRKITVESIHRYIERRLQQHGSKGTIPPLLGPDELRKSIDTEVVS
jgi:excisionase family DNA binding protein